jgi:hypothetical protein
MGLQYYDISVGLNATQEVAAQGRYVYYYAGTTPLITGGVTPGAAGNQAIRVRQGNGGGEIILMPGQSLRLPNDAKAPATWRVSNYKQAEVITGTLLVGEGEFHDSNIANTFKLDATFANTVKVTNDTANRIPVSFDPNQVLNVGQNVNYTNSFLDTTIGALGAFSVLPVFTAAANVNGAYIEFAEIATSCAGLGGGATITLCIKAVAPTTEMDGAVAMIHVNNGSTNGGSSSSSNINQVLGVRVKVPAGMGLYLCSRNNMGASVPVVANKTVLYTLL